MIAVITKEVTKSSVSSILPMFNHLSSSPRPSSKRNKHQQSKTCDPRELDWAVHPGGAAILNGAQQALQLDDDHIRASRDIYCSYGNSSSVTVLIVLDRLRQMGRGRDGVVATSFGPGMVIEMCLMKRWREDKAVKPVQRVVNYGKWMLAMARTVACFRWSTSVRDRTEVRKSEAGKIGG